MTVPNTLQLPTNLRVADLIAKTARVTLKDTLRVLAAFDAVSYLYDVGPTDLIEDMAYDAARPSPEHVAACEQQFFALRDSTQQHADEIRTRLKLIKELM